MYIYGLKPIDIKQDRTDQSVTEKVDGTSLRSTPPFEDITNVTMIVTTVASRLQSAFTTWPSSWQSTLLITGASTVLCGAFGTATGFVQLQDARPPNNALKVASAFLFPSLLEETFWRGICLPTPPAASTGQVLTVLLLHVLVHPVIGESGLWPRGRDTFRDPRFLVLATIVLGGATASYLVTGGSIYAAAFAHAVPLTLWRDFFGGEDRLGGGARI